ncbi:putative small auxin-up RNA [Medicago truncatula]|uniref:Putative small auxin-up RNA n=1 Tax=Medicago truncatula TaxID=3880 RepID=A0A072VKN7_MEDTR|nr:auxin-responsive protein SAUR40 [Medicago truncatula]KEH42196.1 SAUR-like auxin-responsive family protein [Medicago truncatula]RHN79749.1 putative small auxin-up RNA [Medicago truncatula]
MLSSFVEKVQKSLSVFVPRKHALSYWSEDHATTTGHELADDVMKGYFAVLAKKGLETRRFIVGLDYLTDPAFLGLLDDAWEEYGFRQKGTLVVPCRPIDLQIILEKKAAPASR